VTIPNGGKVPVNKAKAGPELTVEEIWFVAELSSLAEDWAQFGPNFGPEKLGRYRELCRYFSMDAAVLLHATQTRIAREDGLSQTGVMPVVADLPDAPLAG
jgi:hypothetical protein